MFSILKLSNWPKMFFNSDFFWSEFETFDNFVKWVLYDVQEWYILGSFTYNIYYYFTLNYFKVFLWLRFDIKNETYIFFFIFLLIVIHIVWAVLVFFCINLYNFVGWLIPLRFVIRYLKNHPIRHKRGRMEYSVWLLIIPSIFYFLLLNILKWWCTKKYYKTNKYYDRIIERLKKKKNLDNKQDVHEISLYNLERRRFNRRFFAIKSDCAHFYYRPFKKQDFENPNFIAELREKKRLEKENKKK